jgi:hypothetical protein
MQAKAANSTNSRIGEIAMVVVVRSRRGTGLFKSPGVQVNDLYGR